MLAEDAPLAGLEPRPRSHASSSSNASPLKSARAAPTAVEYTVDDDPVRHVLYSGLSGDKAARKMQSEAYLQTRHRVNEREDAARAMIISANVLSMSVISSQLQMYRWKVSEAQTITDATSLLQEEIADVNRKGYQVAREKPPPFGVSKYATGDGLAKLRQRNLERIEKRKQQRAERAAARAAGVPLPTNAAGDKTSDGDEDDAAYFGGAATSSGADDDGDSLSSICSAEDGPRPAGKKRNPPPPDTLTRLVLVDCFTHEPFIDIINNLRYMDREYSLELIVVLMLPKANDSLTTQGAGVVLTPQHDLTMEAAYACGYDLVLTHIFDHTVVDFLTNLFVSSSGRWRNDVRSKAAVGNFVSLKNILMGRIDMDDLKQLVFSDGVDDAEILEMIGTQSLALQGETKQFASAAGKMAAEAAAQDVDRSKRGNRGGPDVLVIPGSDDDDEERNSDDTDGDVTLMATADFRGTLSSNLPRLRSNVAPGVAGVRSKNDRRVVPLAGMSASKDMLGSHMTPADVVKHIASNAGQGGDGSGDGGAGFALIDDSAEYDNALLQAMQQEIRRLGAENKEKEETIDEMSEEMERLQKTLAIVKKRFSGGDGKAKRDENNLMLNLTKEQQIYILKERLDEANAQIGELIAVGAGPGFRRRGNNSTSNGRGGGRPTSSAGGRDSIADGSGSAGRSRIARSLERRKQRMIQRYIEDREQDLLAMHDRDAAARWITTAELEADEDGDLTALSERHQMLADDLAKGKRIDEHTTSTIASLQAEMHRMQERLESGGGADDDGVDAVRVMKRLQEAVARLEAQQQRIRQLEEMRRMDETLHKRQLENALQRARNNDNASSTTRRKGGAASKSGAGKGGKAGGKDKGPGSAESTPLDNSVSGGPSLVPSSNQVGELRKQVTRLGEEIQSMRTRHSREIEEAKRSATEAAAQQRRREAQQREQEVGRLLNRLYVKIRQPYTNEYRDILQEELRAAEATERSAKQRLDFALKNLQRQQMREVDEEGIPIQGVIGAIKDPEARERVLAITDEYVQAGMQAAEVRQRLEQLDVFLAGRATSVAQLHQEHAEAVRVARMVQRDGHRIDDYVSAVRKQREVEEQLSRWCDVNALPTLRTAAAMTSPAARAQVLVSPVSTRTDGTAAAATDSASQHQQQQLVRHVDDDVTLRQLADVLHAASAGAEGGSADGKGSASGAGVPTRPSRSPSQIGKHGKNPKALPDDVQGALDELDGNGGLRLDVPPVEGLRGYSGVEASVEESSRVSLTQILLYKTALNNYRSGLVNPDVMAEVDAQALQASPPLEAWSQGYLRLHQELTRLMRTTTQRFPTLKTGVEMFRHPTLEEKIAQELGDLGAGGGSPGRDPVSVPFLMALDSAMVTWVVDFLSGVSITTADLRRRQRDAVLHSTPLQPPDTEAVRKAMTRQLARLRPLQSVDPTDRSLADYAGACVHLAEAAQSLINESGGGGGGQQLGLQEVEGPYGMNTEEALRIAETLKKEGHSAEDLAALFSKPQEYHNLNLQDLYAELSTADKSDENVAIMKEIQMELEYLNMVQKQRMEELALRYRLRQRQQQNRQRNEYHGIGGGGEGREGYQGANGDGQTAAELEVMSGRPGWYGMEAAKRVKNILRRKTRPDQIILDGGDVGEELSRRVAFPKPPPKDSTTSEELARRSAHNLPPVSRRGLSRQQQQRQQAYTQPRDEASVAAYQRVVSQYEFDSVDVYLYHPAELTQRLVAYRDQINRAVSRLGTGNSAVARSLGPPFYRPVPASSGAPPAAPQPGVPQTTSWVYGVSDDRLGGLLSREPATPADADTVLFLPQQDRSEEAQRLENSRMGYSGVQRTRSRRQIYRDGVHGVEPSMFLRGATAYTTPASVAAQRLGAMLRASIADPTVSGPATERSRGSSVLGDQPISRTSLADPRHSTERSSLPPPYPES